MTEKQKLLLQLFREVDAICKKHDLRYVMAGGTLIGVLRNEGFTPWDDDVDIYMPKSDWDKFVEICQNEMPLNRVVYCAEVDRNYTNGFPRYGSTDTCAIHKHQIIGDDKAGEIIDVLTLDPIPDDDREYEKYRDHMMIYTELLNQHGRGSQMGNFSLAVSVLAFPLYLLRKGQNLKEIGEDHVFL